jgi:hypothetical protein
MSNDTNFVTHAAPVIDAPWLNDINDHVFHDTPVGGATVHAASVITNTPAGTIVSTNVQSAINELDTDRQNLTASSGSSLIGYLPAGAGAVATDVEDKLQQYVSLNDYLPAGYVTDGSVDYQANILAAFTYLTSIGGGYLQVPAGTFGSSVQIPTSSLINMVGAGRYKTTFKALSAMASLLQATGESKVSGISFNGNRLATDTLTFNAANGSLFNDSSFDGAIRNGVFGGTTGNNNHIKFNNCAARTNGTSTALTATTTSGNSLVTINSGTIPATTRVGDIILISGVTFGTLTVTPGIVDAFDVGLGTIHVTFTPNSSVGPVAATLLSGSGWDQTTHTDNNIWGFDNCYATGNKLAGLAMRTLYGVTSTNFESDSNYFGFIIGHRGTLSTTEAPIGVSIIGNYTEANTGGGIWYCQSLGTTIIESNLSDVGVSDIVTPALNGLVDLTVIYKGKIYIPNSVSVLTQQFPLKVVRVGPSGGITAGSTYPITVTGADCVSGAISVTAYGDGANTASDAYKVGYAISARTTSGCTLTLINNGVNTQNLFADILITHV